MVINFYLVIKMGIFDNILLLSDYDGTLTGSDGKIPERNIKAIRYFISEGGRFTVSTGRTKIGFHKYSEDIINAPVILGNGAMAFDYKRNEVCFTNAIKKESIPVLNKILEDNPWVCMELYSVDDKAYVINKNEESVRHFRGLEISHYNEITELSEDFFPMVKIMLSTGKRSLGIQKYLDGVLPDFIKYIPCQGSYVEILAQEAGKGNALFQTAGILGIEACNAFAVGDGSNDIDMLEAAHISFVPSSGDEKALASAGKVVCSSDEGAVADAIEYLEKCCLRKGNHCPF